MGNPDADLASRSKSHSMKSISVLSLDALIARVVKLCAESSRMGWTGGAYSHLNETTHCISLSILFHLVRKHEHRYKIVLVLSRFLYANEYKVGLGLFIYIYMLIDLHINYVARMIYRRMKTIISKLITYCFLDLRFTY